jgi:hypothetical protein
MDFPAYIAPDLELLYRQYEFAVSRAEHHLSVFREQAEGQGIARRQEWSVALACAATQFRDAAALAMLLHRWSDAVLHLKVAGELLIENGAFAGLSLLVLAEWAGDFDVSAAIDRTAYDALDALPDEPGQARHRSAERRKVLLDDAATMPRQLYELFRALDARDRRRGRDRMRPVMQRAEAALASLRFPGRFDGTIAYADYVTISRDFNRPELSESTKELLQLAMLNRRTGLIAAHADTFRWRRMINAVSLVDLELLFLALIAIDRGHLREIVKVWGEARDVLRTPLFLARELHSMASANGNAL